MVQFPDMICTPFFFSKSRHSEHFSAIVTVQNASRSSYAPPKHACCASGKGRADQAGFILPDSRARLSLCLFPGQHGIRRLQLLLRHLRAARFHDLAEFLEGEVELRAVDLRGDRAGLRQHTMTYSACSCKL